MRRGVECAPVGRLLSVDYFRGLAVFLMLVYDYVPFFTRDVPLALQHGRSDRLLFGDFVAPFFLFIMGASLAFTICKRRAEGISEREVFLGVLRRAALLLALGLLIDETRAVALGGGFGVTWGVLEALGASYLIAYLVMRFSTPLRIIITGGLLGLHLGLTLAIPWYRDLVLHSAHGSPFSILSWSAIAILGMAAGEWLTRRREKYERFLAEFGAALAVLGLIVSLIQPARKGLVSASYSLITAGGSAFLMLSLYYLIETREVRWLIRVMGPLREFGVAALLAWVLQYVLAVYFIWYFHIHPKLPPAYGISLALGMIVVVWGVVREANRRGLVFKI